MNIIFDMDGLMFDTERVFMDAWDYAGEKIGIGKAGFMVYKTLGMNIISSYNVWKEDFGDRYNQEELRKYTKEFLTQYYENNRVPVKKGLYSLLEYLKGINCKMAVASSSPRWEVEKRLKDAGVSEYFSVIVCGDMIEKSKPEPDIYIKACDLLGVRPEESYALEDSKNGLLSAYNAGCKAIMIPDLWQPDEQIQKIVVGKFDDLEQVKDAFEKGDLIDISVEFRLLFEIDTKDYDVNGTSFSRPSARGIIIQDGKIAMVHSLKYNYYKFPGGGIEQEEKQEEALIREVQEETGLVVIPETICKYGMVHRIQKGDYEDVFIQDNYYFMCDIESVVEVQKLDKYEEEEGFTLEFVTPEQIIQTNRLCNDINADKIMLKREIKVIETLIQEGFFYENTNEIT